MSITEYLLAFLVGLILGLLGGGGSVLTIPILVYFTGRSMETSITYAYFIVGIAALAGTFQYIRKNNSDTRAFLVFGLPSILFVYISRLYIFPKIPSVIKVFSIDFLKGQLLLVIYSFMMLLSGLSMIRQTYRNQSNRYPEKMKNNLNVLLLMGMLVGIITGVVGSGGGFIIIPALVLFGGLAFKQAVGSSLLLISVNCLIGFVTDLTIGIINIEWKFLLIFSFFTFTGTIAGSLMNSRMEEVVLKKIFGYLILIMGCYIIFSEVFT